jgi:acyl-CoA reductase-like NAD-dependent aldehyde dehydrogenase
MRAHPAVIGAFVVGAVALLLVALLVWGGTDLFRTKLHYVLFFDSAVTGLNKGAPVLARGVKVGDPQAEETEMGPLISAGHREKVTSFVDGGVAFQGEVPEGPGFWFPCTLVEATNDDRVAREEVFGPVAAVIPFADEADALRLANDTPFGLSGSIWTRDGARALRMARGIDSGVISVNSNSSVRVSTPFGGFKQSGFGRELGMHGLEGYSEVKNVYVSTD